MNRHSSLFRVAFLSLLMAVALPLLVFVAAQVRHKQLHSTANPRWAGFKKVNGTQALDHPLANPIAASETPSAKDSKPTPDPKFAAKPAPKAGTDLPISSNRLNTNLVSSPSGMTGSAAGSLPKIPQLDPVTVEIPQQQPRQPMVRTAQAAPGRLSSQQTAELQPTSPDANRPVPQPDDTEAAPRPSTPAPKVVAKPSIDFHVADSTHEASEGSRRIETQLAGLQRRLDQLAQAQNDRQVSDLEKALNLLQQAQQSQAQQGQPQPGQIPQGSRPFNPPAVGTYQTPNTNDQQQEQSTIIPPAPRPGRANGTINNKPTGREPSIKIVQGDLGVDDEKFSIQVQDANLSEVLEMLGQLAGVNILASRDVQGRISLNLQDVTVTKALDAIVKSQGFVYEREGDFIYVRTSVEDAAMKQANRKLISKIYQLHYINANEVQKLLDPIMTKGVGRHAVTSPPQTGIAVSATNAGGDGLSQRDTLLVQDYPEVVAEIDKIIVEVDVPPLQVMIEAKILSVALSDTMQFGVNFAMLNGAQNSQLLSGNGSTLNGTVGFPSKPALVPAAGDFIANSAGLKYGFIQGDISGFIKALENIADTTLLAAPQLRVLNKQKAEMIIGQRLSYKTLAFNGNQTVENVQFLDAGTKLIFRPFISPDGLVRLEVHPERSKATINAQTGLPNSETTEVTTNVMVRDGTTVVLGGLISEETVESIDRVPFLGAIPLVGAAFRNKTESLQRNELIVLITPRIVTDPEAAIEGEKLQFETQERAAYFRDHLSPVNRTSLTRAHYERAVDYFESGNLLKAKQQIDAALLQNKGDLECQRMRLKIDQAIHEQQAKAWRWKPWGKNENRRAESRTPTPL